MTSDQKSAFINAQTAMMTAETRMMEADNDLRARRGEVPAYGPGEWTAFIARWEPVLGYNALISFFRD
jgi:hypothetical protein